MMKSLLITIAALAAIAGVAPRLLAQPIPEPKDGKVTYKLTLHPMPAPKPLSRVRLMNDLSDEIPGNKIHGILRSFCERDQLLSSSESEKRYKWSQMTLEEFAKQSSNYRSQYRVFQDALAMNRIDWQTDEIFKRDGFNTLLPDVQKMRQVADILHPSLREHLVAKDFEGAIRVQRMMFELGYMFDSHPTFIGMLVGNAIRHQGFNSLQEMISQPGCPSLYWSLTNMPPISARRMIAGERATLRMLEEKIKKHPVRDVKELCQLVNENTYIEVKLVDLEKFIKHTLEDKLIESMRKELLTYGESEREVKEWSPIQVFARIQLIEAIAHIDEMETWYSVPGNFASERIRHHADYLKNLPPSHRHWQQFTGGTASVYYSVSRTQQRLAALRTIEAIRLHAYENNGNLPTTLDDIKLPLPKDPVTDKPFEYAVKDGIATLHGANPHPENLPVTNIYYELTIAKTK